MECRDPGGQSHCLINIFKTMLKKDGVALLEKEEKLRQSVSKQTLIL